MKLCVIALDYDGTIARDGRIEPLVIEAVKEAQARGIVVILVTGRIMLDLWQGRIADLSESFACTGPSALRNTNPRRRRCVAENHA